MQRAAPDRPVLLATRFPSSPLTRIFFPFHLSFIHRYFPVVNVTWSVRMFTFSFDVFDAPWSALRSHMLLHLGGALLGHLSWNQRLPCLPYKLYVVHRIVTIPIWA